MAERLGRDEAGNVWVIDAQGNPIRPHQPNPMNSPFADPRLAPQVARAQGEAAAAPYIAPKAQADASRAQAEASIASAEAPNAAAISNAQRDKAIAEARKVELEIEKLRLGQTKVDPKSSAYKALQDQIDRVTEIYRQSLQGGVPNAINNVIPDFLQPKVDAFDSAAQGLVNPFMAAFKVPGQGSQSDTELRQFLEANTPAQGDSDAVIEEKLRTIQTRLNAEKPQDRSAPLVGPNAPGLQLAGGKTRAEIDPALRATGSRIGRMLSQGVSDDKILGFLKRSGVDPVNTNIGQALQQRKTPEFKAWQRANPGKPYPIGPEFYTNQVPMSGTRQFINDSAQSALGAGITSSANAMTGGRLDNIAGALGGDPEMIRTGMQLLRTDHPVASLAGDVTGQAALEATLGRIPGARAFMGSRWGQRGTDAAYGAYSGSGEMDGQALQGAGTGALVNSGFGMFGRGLQRGVGGAMTGVRNPSLDYLNKAEVPLTVGQIARGSDSTVGQAVGGIEERFAGLPIADAIIGSARRRGDQGFNRAAFREMGGSGATGAAGVAEGQGLVNNAYNFLDNTTLPLDAQYAGRNAGVRATLPTIPAYGQEIGRSLDALDSSAQGGALAGRDWQSGIRSVRANRSSVAGQPFSDGAVNVLGEVEDNLMGLAQRQGGPGIRPNLDSANRLNSNFQTITSALDNGPAQRADELFSASRLNDASRTGARKFGGRTASMKGDRPFYDLTKAGMDVMPNLTPDSGTAGRSIFYASLPAVLGGGAGATYGGLSDNTTAAEGAAAGGGLGLGATVLPTLALAALYSKSGQKGIQKALLGPRPPKIDIIGEILKKHPRLAGMFASSAGRDFFLQPELP